MLDLEKLRSELDDYYSEMKNFKGAQPDEVFLKLAGWSARASELRAQVVRLESRRMQAFRTREIEPFLEEVDRQFKFFSRVTTIRELDQKLTTSRHLT